MRWLVRVSLPDGAVRYLRYRNLYEHAEHGTQYTRPETAEKWAKAYRDRAAKAFVRCKVEVIEA